MQKIVIKYDHGIYKGESKDGKAHGKFMIELRLIILGRGVLKYPNGEFYKGEWKDDEMHGKFMSSWEW